MLIANMNAHDVTGLWISSMLITFHVWIRHSISLGVVRSEVYGVSG